ncbi:hypothetical protein [Halomonas cupida]
MEDQSHNFGTQHLSFDAQQLTREVLAHYLKHNICLMKSLSIS